MPGRLLILRKLTFFFHVEGQGVDVRWGWRGAGGGKGKVDEDALNVQKDGTFSDTRKVGSLKDTNKSTL